MIIYTVSPINKYTPKMFKNKVIFPKPKILVFYDSLWKIIEEKLILLVFIYHQTLQH